MCMTYMSCCKWGHRSTLPPLPVCIHVHTLRKLCKLCKCANVHANIDHGAGGERVIGAAAPHRRPRTMQCILPSYPAHSASFVSCKLCSTPSYQYIMHTAFLFVHTIIFVNISNPATYEMNAIPCQLDLPLPIIGKNHCIFNFSDQWSCPRQKRAIR